MNEEYMNRGCCKDTMGNLDKKEFMKIMDTSSDFGNTSDIEHLWQWIEQYGKEQRINVLENIKTEIILGQSLISNSQLITTTLNDIENRIKELKKL